MNTFLYLIVLGWLLVLVLLVIGIRFSPHHSSDERLGALFPWVAALCLSVVNVLCGIVYVVIRFHVSS
jgi:hypothetical protein